jgi:hypothetical protein
MCPASDDLCASSPEPAADEPYLDPVIKYYKQFVNVKVLEENLKLTPQQRVEKFQRMLREQIDIERQLQAQWSARRMGGIEVPHRRPASAAAHS